MVQCGVAPDVFTVLAHVSDVHSMVFEVEGVEVVLPPLDLVSVSVRLLGERVASLADHSFRETFSVEFKSYKSAFSPRTNCVISYYFYSNQNALPAAVHSPSAFCVAAGDERAILRLNSVEFTKYWPLALTAAATATAPATVVPHRPP